MSNVPPLPLGAIAWPYAMPAVIEEPTSGGGGGGNSALVTVDFGTGMGDTSTTATVTGQTWVTASSAITATVIGTRAEDAAVEELTLAVGDVVNGVGFTVYAASPLGSIDTYVVACVGV